MGRTPVYFLSHGGPNIMEEVDHPAYHKLQEIGREIVQQVRPKAVVVFSAHWQGHGDTIEVNVAESQELIYDFYGFPSRYYKWQYPNRGDPQLAEKIIRLLKESGIRAKGVRRGLDHGVWASFMCAFDPKQNPLDVPIVQVSLYDAEDPIEHYRLGEAIQSLRDEGVLVIGSGQAVHNLRDMRRGGSGGQPLPYTVPFDNAVKKSAEASPQERMQIMADLLQHPDARRAHPTFEHLLPLHVGAGAAGDDIGKQLFSLPEGSLSWAQYRFGEVSTA